MSTLKVNNIQTASGGSNSTPEQIEQGRAKVWLNMQGSGTVAINDSFNVSSITDSAIADECVLEVLWHITKKSHTDSSIFLKSRLTIFFALTSCIPLIITLERISDALGSLFIFIKKRNCDSYKGAKIQNFIR